MSTEKGIWTALADAGVDIGLVKMEPDGVYSLVAGDTWVAFAETDTTHPDYDGREPAGWDITVYSRIEGEWEYAAQEWVRTEAAAARYVADRAGSAT